GDATTRAGAESVNDTLAVPVAAGVGPTTAGETVSFESVGGAGGGGGAGGVIVPNEPVAGRTAAPAAIVHANGPFPARAELHVQSTTVPVPAARATTFAFASVTVTVQGRDAESRAWKRMLAPSLPLTTGEYSFGSPVAATRWAMRGSSA